MTAIRPSDNALREKIEEDKYYEVLNVINQKYTEMETYISNLESDISSIKEFENEMKADMERGYDVGTALDTLGFQRESLEIDLDFFVHMKKVYMRKLYGDLYQYCGNIIDNALAIEDLPPNQTKEEAKVRKYAGSKPYPGDEENGVTYDMNDIYTLITTTSRNLRELADDIGSFKNRIDSAKAKEARGFSVGNLIVNLEGQQQKLTLEFTGYVVRLAKFLDQNKNFSSRCLNRIKMISTEIVTAEELQQAEEAQQQQQPAQPAQPEQPAQPSA
uniref:Uncharacterized protein n=1 Tax=viral metagenome TaxID=1070528 RepID=A0A6C0JFI3_9ZZZZ